MKGNKLETPLILTSLRGAFYKKALLDSGATENFIDHTMVECLKLGTVLMKEAVLLYNIDGTLNQLGKITHFLNLQVA